MEKLCTCLLFGVLVVNEVGVEGRGGGGGEGAVFCCITAHHRIPVEG